jgi:hypothetical protein
MSELDDGTTAYHSGHHRDEGMGVRLGHRRKLGEEEAWRDGGCVDEMGQGHQGIRARQERQGCQVLQEFQGHLPQECQVCQVLQEFQGHLPQECQVCQVLQEFQGHLPQECQGCQVLQEFQGHLPQECQVFQGRREILGSQGNFWGQDRRGCQVFRDSQGRLDRQARQGRRGTGGPGGISLWERGGPIRAVWAHPGAHMRLRMGMRMGTFRPSGRKRRPLPEAHRTLNSRSVKEVV